MKNILVTGGNGQLASCLKDITHQLTDYNFLYIGSVELNIGKKEDVNAFFKERDISYCINCAAYTQVDKAETDYTTAKKVNEDGSKYLAETCKKFNAVFIQISTDFIFDGKKSTFYTEKDDASPLSVYGRTKLNGEKLVTSTLKEHFIIRTSWLYSEHGNNFLKTMLRLGKEKEKLSVVCDQVGTPTYAKDLAKIILKIIIEENTNYGTYHYSNEGVASWYDFAEAIFEINNIKVSVMPIKQKDYPLPASRPAYSVLDKTKIKENLKINIPHWRKSLKLALFNINN